MRARRPDLLAVDDVALPLELGPCLQAREVRSCPRLGVALTPDLLCAEHGPQEATLQCVGSVVDDRGASQPDAEPVYRRWSPGADELLL